MKMEKNRSIRGFLAKAVALALVLTTVLSIQLPMTVQAAVSGKLGTGGATYTYDSGTKVFTMTGNYVGDYKAFSGVTWDLYGDLPENVRDARTMIIQDCKLSGDVTGLFAQMPYASTITFSNVDTSSVTDFSQMFNGCSSVKSLDLSCFNTSSARTYMKLFYNCTSLEYLDISSWTIPSGSNVQYCFLNTSPKTIKLPKNLGVSFAMTQTYYDANGNKYTTLGPSLAGQTVSTDPNGAQGQGPSTTQNLTGTVTISGKAQNGQKLTATVSDSNASGTLLYQWMREQTAISGATTNSYTLTEYDVGKTISVNVTCAGYTGKLIGKISGPVLKLDGPAAPINLNAVSPTKEGAADGKITGTNAKMEYSTSTNFSSKTACTATQTTGLRAGTYYVRYAETASRQPSAATVVVIKDGPKALSATVTITGTAKVGQTLKVTVTGSNNTGTLYYLWKRGTTDIANSNRTSYTLTSADVGSRISCVIYSSVQQGTVSSAQTATVVKMDGPAAPTGLTSVAASAKGASDGKINGTAVGMEYSTSSGFTTKTACTGSSITGLKAGTYYVRYAETSVSKAGKYVAVTVTDDAKALTGSVTISGTVKCGQTLSATVSQSNNTGTLTYQWMRGSTKITNAVKNTYVLAAADIGQSIRCIVSSTSHTGNISGMITGKVPLDAPVTSFRNTTEGIQINWNAIPGADGYYVYRRVGSAAATKIATLKGGSIKSYVDKNVKIGSAYIYGVKAYKGSIESTMQETNVVAKPVVDSSIKVPSFQVKGVIGGRTVTFNTEQQGGVVYYSTSSSTLTTSDKRVNRGGSVTFSNYYGTIYARTYYNGRWSNVARLILKIPVVNTPTITKSGSGYVTITTTTPSCSIIFTTDGTVPSLTNGRKISASSSRVYVGTNKTVKAIAVRSCFTNSAVATLRQ